MFGRACFEHWAMCHGIDKETAIGVIHADSTVSKGSIDLPDQVAARPEPADITAALEEPAGVHIPNTMHADNGINP
jgi:hypothetical protein